MDETVQPYKMPVDAKIKSKVTLRQAKKDEFREWFLANQRKAA